MTTEHKTVKIGDYVYAQYKFCCTEGVVVSIKSKKVCVIMNRFENLQNITISRIYELYENGKQR